MEKVFICIVYSWISALFPNRGKYFVTNCTYGKKPTVPEASIPLQYCTVAITEPQKGTFQLTWTPTGFFSSTKTYILRVAKESEMVDWVISFKKYIKS